MARNPSPVGYLLSTGFPVRFARFTTDRAREMTAFTETLKRRLIDQALAVRANAHAKYSGFQVGAAVLTQSGAIFSGANVENVSFGLTICAERVAISSAVTAGHKDFVAMVIASAGGGTPCGACRQFAAEFCDDLPVLLVDADNPTEIKEHTLSALLPDAFKCDR